jgi:DNA-binding transcriptional regulator YdaS (Cro superfamily)
MDHEEFLPSTVEFRNLCQKLRSQGNSLMWLSNRLGVHHQTVASWHAGQRRIPADRLDQVAKLVSAS